MHVNKTTFDRNSSLGYHRHMVCNGKTKHTSLKDLLNEKNFRSSTESEPMASALALQCSNQLSYEDPCIGSKPICYNNNYLKLQASYKISPEGVILG